jgi:hypothetical protein
MELAKVKKDEKYVKNPKHRVFKLELELSALRNSLELKK